MTDDSELLRQFVEDGRQEAFAEVVRRHIDFVFSAALRQVGGDRHLASDVTQEVFTIVASKGDTLLSVRSLTAWVYSVTRNRARTHVRSHQRWRKREQEANTMRETLTDESAAAWTQLQPVLDEAMHELNTSDREALLLRFFKGQTLAAIGIEFGLNENSARMRVERALDRLRQRLERRGIASTAAALATTLAGQTTVSAPTGLSASAVACATSALGTGSATSSASAALTLMSTSKVLVAVVVAAALYGIYEWRASASVTNTPVQLKGPDKVTRATNSLPAESSAPSPAAPGIASAPESTSTPVPAPPVLSEDQKNAAIAANLRRLSSAASQFRLENRRTPTLDDLVGGDHIVRELNAVDQENYAALDFSTSGVLAVITASGQTVSYDPASAPKPAGAVPLLKAQAAFKAAHDGASGAGADLLPYFETPADQAAYAASLKNRALLDQSGLSRVVYEVALARYLTDHRDAPIKEAKDLYLLAPYISDPDTRTRLLDNWARVNDNP